MVKQLTHYVCQKCGSEFPKWAGKCTECGEWNSLVETVVSKRKNQLSARLQKLSMYGQAISHQQLTVKPIRLSEVKSRTFKRTKTGISELDRVLGGGIVPGSLVLVAGEPGIGKSTLLTQLALELAKNKNSVFYVCGEESPAQIKIRINRLSPITPPAEAQPARKAALNAAGGHVRAGNHRTPRLQKLCFKHCGQAITNHLLFFPETNIENILASISSNNLIIIDSIQTLWTETLTGSAGSVGQVRRCSNMLLNLAKKTNIPIFLIGHITKGGAIAGPKVLEHLVDTVLYLEGDQQHEFRILRTSKNRFGSTDEVGVFTMTDKGMDEVKDPSRIFLSDNLQKKGGQALTVAMQGVRPMLVEIQALVVSSQLAMPRRVASGIDYKRLQVICAVLQKRLGLPLAASDVFVSVTGGLKLMEPAADLAIALAIASSFKNKSLPFKSVCLGEVGLLGEIRRISFMQKRINQSRKLGYKTIIGEKEKDLRGVLKYLK